MKSTEECGVCGKTLIYQPASKVMQCTYCGRTKSTNIFCPQGHYVCDECHQKEALANLRQGLETSTATAPGDLFEEIASDTKIPMHGPEHHVIVPAVLAAAARNAGYTVPENALEQAITRGSKVPGGWCGFCGACGAAVGVGIAISCLTKATPLTGKERSLAIKGTEAALGAVADGYPRCCKRASRKAIAAAVEYMGNEMGIKMTKAKPVKCRHIARNQQCPKEGCEYYPGKGEKSENNPLP